ncbi:hypothetical protein B0H14DRAFT_3429922 [Mycena olivaceomarginata]|nr:hypothetical protein B0H14DRAFT_3429922 [Mycena olivaceomarginata]
MLFQRTLCALTLTLPSTSVVSSNIDISKLDLPQSASHPIHSILSASAPLPHWDEHCLCRRHVEPRQRTQAEAPSLFGCLSSPTSTTPPSCPPARLLCPSSHHDEHHRSPRPLPRGGPLTRGVGGTPATTPTTPKRPHLVAALPPSAPTTPQIQRTAQELFLSPPLFARVVGSHEHADSDDGGADGRLNRAAGVWQHFHAAEQALYAQLATTPVGALNDVWRAFMIAAKGAGRPAWVRGELAGRC